MTALWNAQGWSIKTRTCHNVNDKASLSVVGHVPFRKWLLGMLTLRSMYGVGQLEY